MKRYIIYIVLMITAGLYAQGNDEDKDKPVEKVWDTISYDEEEGAFIQLGEVVVFEKLKFASYGEKVDYYILRRKVHKVYPYAKLAAERITAMNTIIDTLSSNRLKKRYIKRMQHYIEDEFTEELKKMTRTEGQILVKLIYRQTGETAFGLVKEYRSGWNAFWYNTTASLFDISLKEKFDPENSAEDFIIEDILQRAFASGTLESQNDAIHLDYDALVRKWRK